LFASNEWEYDVRGRQPDLDALGDTALAPLLNKKLRRDLKPVFETRVRRRVLDVRSGNSRIELSIDKGTVAAGARSCALCEVELELKQGQPGALFMLAKALAQELPLQLGARSKADRGYTLLTARKAAPVKATAVALAPDAN